MEYQRDTECIRCLGWFDKADGHVTPATDGAWFVCDKCWEALGQDEQDDEEYSSKISHEGQYEDEAVVEAIDLGDENDSLALLIRTTAGLRVEALQGFIVVTQNGKSVTADVSDECLLDAFDHPALYIGAEACATIGLR